MITILDAIWKFLMGLFGDTKIVGELDVTGSDEARFDLFRKPEFVSVEFADDDSCVPCDPGVDDTLEWEIKKIGCGICCDTDDVCSHPCQGCSSRRKHWTLVIKWNVAGIRKVVWEVCN